MMIGLIGDWLPIPGIADFFSPQSRLGRSVLVFFQTVENDARNFSCTLLRLEDGSDIFSV
jgi:hypothetical protein